MHYHAVICQQLLGALLQIKSQYNNEYMSSFCDTYCDFPCALVEEGLCVFTVLQATIEPSMFRPIRFKIISGVPHTVLQFFECTCQCSGTMRI